MGRKRKNYKYVIITDKDSRPMAWDEDGKQLAYCTDDRWEDEHHPVRFYTRAKAARLIKKSTARKEKRQRFNIEYKTMPFELTYWQESISKGKKI